MRQNTWQPIFDHDQSNRRAALARFELGAEAASYETIWLALAVAAAVVLLVY